MLEKWKSAADNKNLFGALLTDLSMAFDCLSHDLLIAKLNAYGFSMAALNQIGSKGLRSTQNIARGKKFYLEFHRVPYSGLSYSIFFFVISS